jgi:hypothetical protein
VSWGGANANPGKNDKVEVCRGRKMRTILIAMLVLTNAITGVSLWRSHQQVQYQSKKASTFADLYFDASKQNHKPSPEIPAQITKPYAKAIIYR